MEGNVDLRNWLKLKVLLNRATDILRKEFRSRFKQCNEGNDWVNCRESGTQFINGLGKDLYHGAKPLQKRALENGDVNLWDLTTVVTALQILFSTKPEDKQEMKEDEVQRLLCVRNKIDHHPTKILADKEFSTLWQEVCSVLIALGDCEEDLNNLKATENLSGIDSGTGDTGVENEYNKSLAAKLKITGNEYFNNNVYLKAVDKYTEALGLMGLCSKDRAVLFANRSVAYLKLNDQQNGKSFPPTGEESMACDETYGQKALYDAKQAIILWPTWWRAYYRAGCAYSALNKMEKAVDLLDRALALEPVNQDVKDARDHARMKISQQSHLEHFDQKSLDLSVKDDHNRRFCHKDSFVVRPLMATTMTRVKDLRKELSAVVDNLVQAENYHYGLNEYPVNYSLAAAYYEKAASADHPFGMYNLAVMTVEGKGVQRDISKAVNLLKQAAGKAVLSVGDDYNVRDLGIAESQHALGVLYEDGIGVFRSPSIAAFWYEKASDNGSAEAAYNLGLLYINGNGVDQNFDRGMEYIKMAANRGAPNASLILAWEYALDGDLANAESMYKRVTEHGSGHTALIQEAFGDLVKETASKMKSISLCEAASEMDSKEMSLADVEENLDKSTKEPEIEEQLETILVKLRSLVTPCSPVSPTEKFDYYDIKEHASRGSEMAKILLSAKESCLRALAIIIHLRRYETEQKDLETEVVCLLSHAVRTEALVVHIPPEFTEELMAVIQHVMEAEGSSESQRDIDARYCFAWLNMTTFTSSTSSFLKECYCKYPNESGFHRMRAALLAFVGQFEEALKELDAVLALSSNPVCDIWFERASYLALLPTSVDLDKAFEENLNFLKLAPEDHRFVPDAHYALASLRLIKGDKTRGKKRSSSKSYDGVPLETREYYEKGLKLEKIQLPFFLPYQSKNKLFLERVFREVDVSKDFTKVQSPYEAVAAAEDDKEDARESQVDAKGSKESTKAQPEAVAEAAGDSENVKESEVDTKLLKRKEILRSPARIELLCHFRTYCKFVNSCKEAPFSAGLTIQPRRRQRGPKSVANLRVITFKDMDPYVDRVYRGCVVHVTLIVETLTGGSSLVTIVEDENGDAHRCCIYNFEHEENDAVVQDVYGLGYKMLLLNPYMRCAADGKSGIRVDDPYSLVNADPSYRPRDVCRFCLTEDAKHVCGRCKRARYCSRDCQVDDWKLYKHKLVCEKAV